MWARSSAHMQRKMNCPKSSAREFERHAVLSLLSEALRVTLSPPRPIGRDHQPVLVQRDHGEPSVGREVLAADECSAIAYYTDIPLHPESSSLIEKHCVLDRCRRAFGTPRCSGVEKGSGPPQMTVAQLALIYQRACAVSFPTKMIFRLAGLRQETSAMQRLGGRSRTTRKKMRRAVWRFPQQCELLATSNES